MKEPAPCSHWIVVQAGKPLPVGAVEAKDTSRRGQEGRVFLHFPHPPPHAVPATMQEDCVRRELAAEVPRPISAPLFSSFGSENDSGYQAASGVGLWNAFAFQRARKLPRITKRHVRTTVFRKQPY